MTIRSKVKSFDFKASTHTKFLMKDCELDREAKKRRKGQLALQGQQAVHAPQSWKAEHAGVSQVFFLFIFSPFFHSQPFEF